MCRGVRETKWRFLVRMIGFINSLFTHSLLITLKYSAIADLHTPVHRCARTRILFTTSRLLATDLHTEIRASYHSKCYTWNLPVTLYVLTGRPPVFFFIPGSTSSACATLSYCKILIQYWLLPLTAVLSVCRYIASATDHIGNSLYCWDVFTDRLHSNGRCTDSTVA
jgi:hypothetical protein